MGNLLFVRMASRTCRKHPAGVEAFIATLMETDEPMIFRLADDLGTVVGHLEALAHVCGVARNRMLVTLARIAEEAETRS